MEKGGKGKGKEEAKVGRRPDEHLSWSIRFATAYLAILRLYFSERVSISHTTQYTVVLNIT